jgi:predicted RNase H-like HicB family nuclease
VSKTAGYIALVHKDKGTSYGVSFPDVPGCISAGDTFEEAIDNAAVALAGHLAIMEADGDLIPRARSLEELKGMWSSLKIRPMPSSRLLCRRPIR